MRTGLKLTKLVLAQLARSRGRTLIALAGVAVAVCLIVWVIRGYDAVMKRSAQDALEQTGRYDVVVSPKDRMRPQVDRGLLEEIGKDKEVAEFETMTRSRVRIMKPEAAIMQGPFSGAGLMGTGAKTPPCAMAEGRWLAEGSEGEAVMSTSFRDRRKGPDGTPALKVGDELTIGGNGCDATLKIVGTVKRPAGGGMMSPEAADIYVLPKTAEAVNGYGDRPNLACIVMKESEKSGEFAKAWAEKAGAMDPPATVRSLRDRDEDPMGDRMNGMIRVQATNAGMLAFLAAAFIIYTVLSASGRERTRQYAILRAVGLSRTQLVAMILFEAVLFAAGGWAAGLLLVKGFLKAGQALGPYVAAFKTTAFSDYPLGTFAIVTAGICALAGAMAAAILPAWRAARLKPIAVLSGPGEQMTRRFPWVMVSIGLVLIAVNPVIVYLAQYEGVRKALSYTIGRGVGFKPPLVGCVAMIIGFALITPLAVRVAEAVFTPMVAWAMGIDRRLLRQQLSADLWRTVGTTIALGTGLALFVTIQVWGYSMLVPFTPDKSLPRMLVSILPAGVPESAIGDVKGTAGVIGEECLPMVVEQPKLTEETLKSKPFESVDASQQYILVMGVEPGRAFGGAKPVMPLEFVQGNREEAAKKLAEGKYCLVPDNFATQTGLGVGDRFSVAAPNRPGTSVGYTIAGVVSAPGWHWFTKFSDVRRRSGRALALVFVDYGQAKTDYAIDRISYFWMNADESVTYQEMEKRLEPIATANAGVKVNVPMVGEAAVAKQYVKITDRAHLTEQLMKRANDVIWSLTWFPLIALGITSLAVFNTVMASVQARNWQMGVLRGVGMTGGQLLRTILSESILICATASALSLTAGILLAWCGTHICTYFFYFGGMTPPLVLPWGMLGMGFGMALGLCLLAGIIPAAMAAAKEPLTFIRKGRLA